MAFYCVGWGLEIVPKKLFAVSNSFWCHFTAHIINVATFLSLHNYMDLTIARIFFSRVTSRLDELKSIFLLCVICIMTVYMRFLFHQTMSMFYTIL